jgi:hypothetical protein
VLVILAYAPIFERAAKVADARALLTVARDAALSR